MHAFIFSNIYQICTHWQMFRTPVSHRKAFIWLARERAIHRTTIKCCPFKRHVFGEPENKKVLTKRNKVLSFLQNLAYVKWQRNGIFRKIFRACEKWGQEASKRKVNGISSQKNCLISYTRKFHHVQTQNILFNSVYITSRSLTLIVSFRARNKVTGQFPGGVCDKAFPWSLTLIQVAYQLLFILIPGNTVFNSFQSIERNHLFRKEKLSTIV